MAFVFVPYEWNDVSVEVGTFDDYPSKRLSDHVPVIVTIRST